MDVASPRFVELEACPVCGSPAHRERFVCPDRILSVPGRYRYVECAACATVYQNPRVQEDDLALCYPAAYFTHGTSFVWTPNPAPAGSLRDLLKRAIRKAADDAPDKGLPRPLQLLGRLLAWHPGLRRRGRLGLVDGLAPPPGRKGRCLEVGPGQGFDLWRLRTLGWEAHGLEMDPVAAQQARERSGCPVEVGTLASTHHPPGSFDLVYLSHVFEHLPDPHRSLQRCLDLLAPGGRLILIYPNPGALTARLYGANSVVWEPPRHLVLPSPAAVEHLLRGLGFAQVEVRSWAREAAVNYHAARKQASGGTWSWRRPDPAVGADRCFAVIESSLVALGWRVGEEVVVRGRKTSPPPAAGTPLGPRDPA